MNHKEREFFELGSETNPIVDSQMSEAEALAQNPESMAPPEVLARQRVVAVEYRSFDGRFHRGQIVVDQDLEKDVKELFGFMLGARIPVGSAVPVADAKLRWDDNLSMAANNASGFNYRIIKRTGKLSNHALGRAIDINPMQNPYEHDGKSEPAGTVYNIDQPGTWSAESPVVKFLKDRGWEWGGDWEEIKDYHHFQKLE